MTLYRGSTVPGQGGLVRGNADEIDIDDAGNLIDATNVEDALQEIVTNTNYLKVATVADMKLLSVDAGETIQTQGYYTAGDGGAATYLVVAPQTFDGYGDHELANGNIAVLQRINNIVNVRQFGAKGDNATDDTTAIQAAINYARVAGYDIYFPGGTYRISTGLTLIINALERTSNMYGDGKTSVIDWRGANNGVMYQIYAGVLLRAVQSICSIKTLHFTNSIAATGVVGIQIGTPGVDLYGVGNMTIAENSFFELDTCIDIKYESDEMTIERNHMDTYTSYGIYNDRNNIMRFNNNHMQSGLAGSYGIYSTGGQSLSINGNAIQTSTASNSIYLTDANGFTILGNYTETSAVVGNSMEFNDCSGGLIAGNHIGGFPASDLYLVSGASHSIEFGANDHTQSGGLVSSLINVTGTSDNIAVSAKQNTSGSIDTLAGTGYSIQVNETRTIVPALQSLSGTLTIGSFGTATIFTAEDDGMYHLYVSQNTNLYSIHATIYAHGGVAAVFVLGESNPGALNITFSGADVIIDNTISATRGFKWYAQRMA